LNVAAEGLVQTVVDQEPPLEQEYLGATAPLLNSQQKATPSLTSESQEERIDPPEPGPPSVLSLAATPIATIAPIPTGQAKNQKQTHFLSSDLLFLAGHSLIRWDHHTHFGVALAEYVSEFSPDGSGNRIALLRSRGVTANGAELYDLDLLDLQTMQIARLLQETSNIGNVALSPDGKWLAFSQPLQGREVLVFPVSNPAQITGVGSCLDHDQMGCSTLNWSPDSQNLLWSDHRGIWMADMANVDKTDGDADCVNPGVMPILDPEGKPSEIEAWLSSPLWSPAGRFVLLEVSPKQSNVRWQAVLDVSSRRIIQVIDSYETLATDASLSWLEDGRLAVARASSPNQNPALQGSAAPTIQLWQVVPTHSSLLIPGNHYPIRTEAIFTEEPSSTGLNPALCFEWLQPMEPGHLLVSARVLNADHQPVLFRLDLGNGFLTPIAETAIDTQQILWAPDHSGFLAIGTDQQMSYFSIEVDKWFNLSSFGEADPNSARWLPPVLR